MTRGAVVVGSGVVGGRVVAVCLYTGRSSLVEVVVLMNLGVGVVGGVVVEGSGEVRTVGGVEGWGGWET